MANHTERARMKQILSEAIAVLCKASLTFHADLCVEGLLGITLDEEEIILVNINETVQKERQKRTIRDRSPGLLNN